MHIFPSPVINIKKLQEESKLFTSLMILILLLLFVALTVREKAFAIASRSTMPDETKSSPFSRALMELIAIAGGIYLSLVMLVSFLNITVPEKISVLGINVEPLAALSLIIAIIQPWVIKFLKGRVI